MFAGGAEDAGDPYRMDLNGIVLEADEIPEIIGMQGTGMGCLSDRASKPQGID